MRTFSPLALSITPWQSIPTPTYKQIHSTGYAVRNRQAFLAKQYKGGGRAEPKVPHDMPQHELDAIRAAAAKAGTEPPKASARASRSKLKAMAGRGGGITERLRLQIPVPVETVGVASMNPSVVCK